MARTSPSAARLPTPEPVSWRNGVHLGGTPIWCDAWRARDVCFVSAADAIGTTRHGQLIGTRETLAQLTRHDPRHKPDSQLTVPYDRPFTLGTIRLELVRSGHAFGAASLLVEVEGRRIFYAGAICPQGGGLGGAAEQRGCDVLVVAAAYAAGSLPPVETTIAALGDRALEITERRGTHVLLVSSASKGLDVAARLGERGVPLRAHRSIHHAAQKVRDLAALPSLARAAPRAGATLEPGVLIWPVAARPALDRLTLPPGSRLELVSGAALDPAALAELGVDGAVAWSNHADPERLRAYIDSSGARRVYLTHRHAESLAAALDRPERPVRPLGPPRQMSLFA